jgi:phosphomevalonate kinase
VFHSRQARRRFEVHCSAIRHVHADDFGSANRASTSVTAILPFLAQSIDGPVLTNLNDAPRLEVAWMLASFDRPNRHLVCSSHFDAAAAHLLPHIEAVGNGALH